MICESCGNPLSGRQTKWCSAACRQKGNRSRPVALSVSDGARRRFMARFDGWEFEVVESVVLEQAAALFETVERLEAVDDPSVAVLRELRQHRQAIVALLQSMGWEDVTA